MSEKTFLVALGIVTLSILLILVFVVIKDTVVVPAPGGEFTEGAVGQPANINPVTANTETDLSLVKLVYSNLPSIADKVQPSTDGKTWTVRLKDNLHWQDGQKLTSDDVIFTIQSIQNPSADSPLASEWQGVTVARGSELEFTFTLATPYAFFSSTLNDLYVVPKHLFADIPPANWHLSDYDLKPVGSGPYQFKSYDQRSDGFITDYHLTAWNSYWGTKPLIQNFGLAFFPNENALMESFNNAGIDGFAANPEDLADIKRPYDVFPWPTSEEYAVFWNQGNNNPAIADSAVRTALAESVDRDGLVTDALGGKGTASAGPIPPGAPSAISGHRDDIARRRLGHAHQRRLDSGPKRHPGFRRRRIRLRRKIDPWGFDDACIYPDRARYRLSRPNRRPAPNRLAVARRKRDDCD